MSKTPKTLVVDETPHLTDYAVAPGEFLAEWISEQAPSPQPIAERLGFSGDQLDEIITGRVPVTRETAHRLERVVGIPVDALLRYEAAYRADLARLAG
ncbi:helix-turn-helix transcriptional regulator [Cryobacterium zhongshanensis]|uniref:Uncharacterized protein n=1 Tax=Cryobacterium zhongshanensis TaxID=2928153 RepID=A0AA41QYE4_9MICO|nr:hypothetical protein [Cryobacterium zhongshanensis]MCI4659777.1 hypothetical protein [Cryobacterium zhongshanensis]